MKKLILFFAISILLMGCAKEKTDILETLTIESVEALAAKHESLVIEDFAPYLDISSIQETGGLWEILEFPYHGETMCLRVYASKKSQTTTHYSGALDAAVLFRKDFLELDTQEKEYAYEGTCADIRAGNLEHILNGTVEMEDYITCTLLEGLTESKFRYWMGTHGGVAFLREGEEDSELTLENTGLHGEKLAAGGIEIWGNGELPNRRIVEVEELESLKLGELMLRREIWQTEEGNSWYISYTDQEGSCISYYLYLNAAEYMEEEFLRVTETIRLQKHAIY